MGGGGGHSACPPPTAVRTSLKGAAYTTNALTFHLRCWYSRARGEACAVVACTGPAARFLRTRGIARRPCRAGRASAGALGRGPCSHPQSPRRLGWTACSARVQACVRVCVRACVRGTRVSNQSLSSSTSTPAQLHPAPARTARAVHLAPAHLEELQGGLTQRVALRCAPVPAWVGVRGRQAGSSSGHLGAWATRGRAGRCSTERRHACPSVFRT